MRAGAGGTPCESLGFETIAIGHYCAFPFGGDPSLWRLLTPARYGHAASGYHEHFDGFPDAD